MTNPNNAVGTNAAFGGRTSPNAFNDGLAALSAGVVSGWGCVPKSGLTVSIGGSGTVRDVAIAIDNIGNKTTINNITGSPIDVTISAAPGANTRIDSIVAYVDNPPQGSATVTDNYGACGLIAVTGTASATPVPPNESAIRTAITAEGATGSTAYYVVLAYVTMASGTTDITSGEISAGPSATLSSASIANASITSAKMSLTNTTDTNGWTVLPLSSKVNLYLKSGVEPITQSGSSWRVTKIDDGPVALDINNPCFGLFSGHTGDAAISVNGSLGTGPVGIYVDIHNSYSGSVTTNIVWSAIIVELLP